MSSPYAHLAYPWVTKFLPIEHNSMSHIAPSWGSLIRELNFTEPPIHRLTWSTAALSIQIWLSINEVSSIDSDGIAILPLTNRFGTSGTVTPSLKKRRKSKWTCLSSNTSLRQCQLEFQVSFCQYMTRVVHMAHYGESGPQSEASNIILGKNIENIVITFMVRSVCGNIIQMRGAPYRNGSLHLHYNED